MGKGFKTMATGGKYIQKPCIFCERVFNNETQRALHMHKSHLNDHTPVTHDEEKMNREAIAKGIYYKDTVTQLQKIKLPKITKVDSIE
jgi:hypothetical protein